MKLPASELDYIRDNFRLGLNDLQIISVYEFASPVRVLRIGETYRTGTTFFHCALKSIQTWGPLNSSNEGSLVDSTCTAFFAFQEPL